MLSQTPAAIRMRERRAAFTAAEREAHLGEKRARAAADRADPKKRAKHNAQANEKYRKDMQDPQRKAERRNAERERYWLNQPWRIAQEARIRATKKGLSYDLTKDWAFSTWTGFCSLTGIQFAARSTSITAYSPSIDRIDNAKGYTKANCRWILYGVNALKNTGTDEDVLRIARAITERSA
jgi:hypothetical protein